MRANFRKKRATNVLKYLNKMPLLILIIFLLFNDYYLTKTNCQVDEDDLTFDYKNRNRNDEERGNRQPPKRKLTKPKTKTSTSTTSPSMASITSTTMPGSSQTGSKPLASNPLSLGGIGGSSTISPKAGINLTAHSAFTSPFISSTETLNKTHANMFKSWLETKSDELFELSMNYSGYKLLNETYNLQLRKDAQFAWINFTSMIMNISKTISQVLYNKTLIVKNLSDLVEKTYDEYRNDSQKIEESAFFLYYDAKSPKTFCDLQEVANRKNNQTTKEILLDEMSESLTSETDTDMSTQLTTDPNRADVTTTKSTTDSPHPYAYQLHSPLNNITNQKFNYKKAIFNFKESEHKVRVLPATTKLPLSTNSYRSNQDSIEFDWVDLKMTKKTTKKTRLNEIGLRSNLNEDEDKDYESYEGEDSNCLNTMPYLPPKYHPRSHNHMRAEKSRRHKLVKRQQEEDDDDLDGATKKRKKLGSVTRNRTGITRPPGISGKRKKPKKTTTPSTNLMYDETEERTDLDFYDDYFMQNLQEKPFWNITCINRTFDENFKNFPKGVNRNKSTIHVPINVYKQDITINMTAYWTEALNKQFKDNYDKDNELFWQYFCSSHGLLRRYPGALWTVPHREDFFDCRLQSWYIMAAASPKDVLILMDSSGSMTGLRLEIAKKLIESIMDTLSDNDFFNILTFSNTVNYLMNSKNESEYRGRFIMAGKNNKLRFMEKLKTFKNTQDIANLDDALTASFNLLLNENLEDESCKCNKVIMIITDGSSENAEAVFKKYNWDNGRKVRVFTFLIGRDNVDQRQVQWMACANDGQFFHVATIADVNEHVHEYIPVLSRPMALLGQHETTWSNVFIGHLDKELKIAVARPAFKTKDSLLAKTEVKFNRNQKASTSTSTPNEDDENEEETDDYYDDYYDDENEGSIFILKILLKIKNHIKLKKTFYEKYLKI